MSTYIVLGRDAVAMAGSPGHYPAVADVDGDGRDEVFVGYNNTGYTGM